MSTGQPNVPKYLPAKITLRGRIHTLIQITAFPRSGELRSIPAEISGTGNSLRIRSTSPKEHPVESSTSEISMEPRQGPVDFSNLEPTSRF
jgi:hypothetical protein